MVGNQFPCAAYRLDFDQNSSQTFQKTRPHPRPSDKYLALDILLVAELWNLLVDIQSRTGWKEQVAGGQ